MPQELPEYVNLCGIRYRTQSSEGLVTFTVTDSVWGRYTSILFTADTDGMCWYVQVNSTNGTIMVSHLIAAYEALKKAYGKNFEIKLRG